MSPKKVYIDAPVPILDVLNAALDQLANDKRFTSVPNGHLEVSWCQPAKDRYDGTERPARYRLTIECGFDPERPARLAPPRTLTGKPGEQVTEESVRA